MQSDTVARAVCVTAIVLLMLMIVNNNSRVNNSTKVYANVIATGNIIQLKHWWETL